MLSVHGITKRFGDLLANDSVDLELAAGSLHAVLGENGAGKSTLMKILSGLVLPDAGSVSFEGRPVELGSPREALRAGIGMLHQEPLVCLPFTNRENFRLGSGWSLSEAGDRMTAAGERLGFRVNPEAITRTLSVGERQQLEVVRLLESGCRVLILDEPTGGISATQRIELFAALRRLAEDGLIVLFVSHKLEEVNELCRSVTVMRHGRVAGSASLPRPENELVQLMFDQTASSSPTRTPVNAVGAVVAELKGASAGVGRGAIRSVDLQLQTAEVVGVAGLEGSGQGSLLRSLAGRASLRQGRVLIDGADLTHKSAAKFAKAGVGLLPGGRLEEGLIAGLSAAEHLELADGQRLIIDWSKSENRCAESITAFRIQGKPATLAEELSGGNQQRLLLALLPHRLRLLLMEHPTRGLDLESAAYIWSKLLARRRDGTAIMFASSDLDEILTYSDRVLVCFDGRVIAERNTTSTSAEEIGSMIGGKVGV
ncbi:MAG: ABC transporter ATP-binding protein [Actinomycetota bacterium]